MFRYLAYWMGRGVCEGLEAEIETRDKMREFQTKMLEAKTIVKNLKEERLGRRIVEQVEFYIKAYNTLSSCYPPMSNKSRTHYNREQAILRRAKREILRTAIKVGLSG